MMRKELFFWCILISIVILSISILSCVPPVSRDALTHHLFIPKLYLQHGGIYEIPHVEFSYYPMNLDLLYMVPLYFKNDIVPKYIHFAFALLTAAMIYRYLYGRLTAPYPLLGALFFLSIPIIVRLSSTVYVDLGLICFSFASLIYLFEWIKNDFSFKYIFLSAVFCGLALGTKYNGLICLFLLSLFVAFVYARLNSEKKLVGIRSAGWWALFVTVAIIVFSPWMIRNIVWTGNPVYPLYNSIFNPGTASMEIAPENVPQEHSRMSHVQVRHQIYGESLLEIAMLPIRVFFQGKDDDPKYFDGRMNPFLLLLPILAFIGFQSGSRQVKIEKWIMLAFSVLFLLYACAQTDARIRYFSPIIPPLVVLSMFGLHSMQVIVTSRFSILPELKKIIVPAVILAMLGLNGSYILERFRQDQPMAYISGKVTRDQYIQAFRPEYASFQYANEHLGSDSKILGLYVGNRGYYSDKHIEFSLEVLQKYAASAASAVDVADKLHGKGFSHLLVNFSLFNYWVQQYNIHEKHILKEFFDNYTVTEFSKDGYGLLRVKFDATAAFNEKVGSDV